MSIVDFVRDGSRMSFYRDVSEIMNKAGLYCQTETKEKDKEKHFIKIVDLLEELDFNGNWFDANWVLQSDIKNMCELLEIDEEQFRMYVGSFAYQVWVDVSVSDSESESDSDGEEDSGAGAVEDSDDKDEKCDICDAVFDGTKWFWEGEYLCVECYKKKRKEEEEEESESEDDEEEWQCHLCGEDYTQ